jgi:hypothetical protein
LPGIDDRGFECPINLPKAAPDHAMLRRELDGIRQQIPEDLLESHAVGVEFGEVGLSIQRYLRVLDVRRGLHEFDRCSGNLLDVNRGPPNLQLPRHHAGDVQQIVDNLSLPLGVGEDRWGSPIVPCPVARSGASQRRSRKTADANVATTPGQSPPHHAANMTAGKNVINGSRYPNRECSKVPAAAALPAAIRDTGNRQNRR